MKLVCDDKIPYLKGVLEPYVDEVLYLPGANISNADLLDVDALIVRTRTSCNATLLKGTGVRFIATATIGYDHIDTQFCAQNNIYWTNAPGCNSGSVKQYIAATLAFLANKRNSVLSGKTLGIVGVGNVGRKVVDVARAYGMHVLLNDPPRAESERPEAFVSLDDLLAASDVISFHVPLSMEGRHKTHHLLDKERIAALQPHQIIINSSRGEVVDNASLALALREHKIAGAVMDVWEGEPDVHRELLQLTDLATPHIAGYSKDGKANGTAMSVQALSAFFDLPLKDWKPAIQTKPPMPQTIFPAGDTGEMQLRQAVLHTYPIDVDSQLLKEAPDDFEKQRGTYWDRREFHAYTVCDVKESLKEALQCLGFEVK